MFAYLNHVDERVANVAFVLEIDGQVEEVVRATEALVDRGQQHLLRVLVGDIFDHQRRAPVLATGNLLQVESVQLLLLAHKARTHGQTMKQYHTH